MMIASSTPCHDAAFPIILFVGDQNFIAVTDSDMKSGTASQAAEAAPYDEYSLGGRFCQLNGRDPYECLH
jgi:hypothetical protein